MQGDRTGRRVEDYTPLRQRQPLELEVIRVAKVAAGVAGLAALFGAAVFMLAPGGVSWRANGLQGWWSNPDQATAGWDPAGFLALVVAVALPLFLATAVARISLPDGGDDRGKARAVALEVTSQYTCFMASVLSWAALPWVVKAGGVVVLNVLGTAALAVLFALLVAVTDPSAHGREFTRAARRSRIRALTAALAAYDAHSPAGPETRAAADRREVWLWAQVAGAGAAFGLVVFVALVAAAYVAEAGPLSREGADVLVSGIARAWPAGLVAAAVAAGLLVAQVVFHNTRVINRVMREVGVVWAIRTVTFSGASIAVLLVVGLGLDGQWPTAAAVAALLLGPVPLRGLLRSWRPFQALVYGELKRAQLREQAAERNLASASSLTSWSWRADSPEAAVGRGVVAPRRPRRLKGAAVSTRRRKH